MHNSSYILKGNSMKTIDINKHKIYTYINTCVFFLLSDDKDSTKISKSLTKTKCTIDSDTICNDIQVKKQQVSK